ncbi:hypothetical protein CBL_02335 [Carabus blaptoides fortunei]
MDNFGHCIKSDTLSAILHRLSNLRIRQAVSADTEVVSALLKFQDVRPQEFKYLLGVSLFVRQLVWSNLIVAVYVTVYVTVWYRAEQQFDIYDETGAVCSVPVAASILVTCATAVPPLNDSLELHYTLVTVIPVTWYLREFSAV